ncbi:MAG: hypothetical protein ACI85N_002017 [Gammaproteobacteria bacterium]|jgi:hypothetical protein
MLVTFTTKAYADITMFGEVGVSMLKMMGHSGIVPGAILADDVPTALAALQDAISGTEPQTTYDEDGEPNVSMHNRALPLIELLTTAANEGSDVMWE